MEKGYYKQTNIIMTEQDMVAIHNKNGKGLLLFISFLLFFSSYRRNPQ